MHRAVVLGLVLALPAFIGCLGGDDQVGENSLVDEAADAAADWAAQIPDAIGGIEHTAQAVVDGAQAVPSGAGIWMDGDYAYVSSLNAGFHVLDVSDPTNPVVVGAITEDLFSRDADMFRTDNRSIVVLATQSGGMTFVDVTDPTMPAIVSILDIDPNHNVAVVPGTCLVYNSPSGGAGGTNEIVDACDPENPQVVGEWGTHGCHDTTFWSSPDGSIQRAYCAGVQMTNIWDIADPLAPEKVSDVSNVCMDRAVPQGRSNCGGLHHSVYATPDGQTLIIGDEFQGGGGPGCGATETTPAGTVSTPVGALWFYDISDETAPEMLGWFAPDVPVMNHADAMLAAAEGNPTAAPFSASCTSHFGTLVPGKDMIVIGWYHAGVILVDFSDPTQPAQVDQWNPGTQVWDARIHNGYVFTGDIVRGLDVLSFVPA